MKHPPLSPFAEKIGQTPQGRAYLRTWAKMAEAAVYAKIRQEAREYWRGRYIELNERCAQMLERLERSFDCDLE